MCESVLVRLIAGALMDDSHHFRACPANWVLYGNLVSFIYWTAAGQSVDLFFSPA